MHQKKYSFFFTHLGASLPLDLYEGLHDHILTLPDCNEPNPFTKTTTKVTPEMSNSCQSSVQNRNIPQDFVTATECKEVLHAAMKSLEKKLNNNENDQDFLREVLKFANRVNRNAQIKIGHMFSCIWSSWFMQYLSDWNIYC